MVGDRCRNWIGTLVPATSLESGWRWAQDVMPMSQKLVPGRESRVRVGRYLVGSVTGG